MSIKFRGKKYMTVGVKHTIGLEIQMLLWGMLGVIIDREDFKLDYLQVFELKGIQKDGKILQQITHRQEVEPYEKTCVFEVTEPVNEKLFLISTYVTDEEYEYSTLMLASEY